MNALDEAMPPPPGTGAGPAGVPDGAIGAGATPGASPGVGPVGVPSHSRNAPHEPQNWSPGMFANPQRRQMVFASSVIRVV